MGKKSMSMVKFSVGANARFRRTKIECHSGWITGKTVPTKKRLHRLLLRAGPDGSRMHYFASCTFLPVLRHDAQVGTVAKKDFDGLTGHSFLRIGIR
jgi:hypothetical protein